ncbi:3784_t:CDS:1, partial [Dentiscutata heterogama]
ENQAHDTSSATISPATDAKDELHQGNYPPTPIFNNILTNATPMQIMNDLSNLQDNENQKQPNKPSLSKKGGHKFPAINYSTVKQMPVVEGFSNPLATKIESIRLWWVTNWTEGQKIIEMLAQKPNLKHEYGNQ